MTLLTDLRNTFTLSNQTLYEEIKAVRYNEKLIELEVMEKLLEIKDDMIKTIKPKWYDNKKHYDVKIVDLDNKYLIIATPKIERI